MKLKYISKLLTIGVLLNSLTLNTYASTIIPTNRYEDFDSNYITVDDSLESYNTDLKLKGASMINLSSGEFIKAGSGNATVTQIENGANLNVISQGSAVLYRRAAVKDNTVYTLVCDISTNMDGLSFSFKQGYNYSQGLYNDGTAYNPNGYRRFVVKLRTTTDCTDIVIGNHSNENYAGTFLSIRNMMLFEGDLTSSIPKQYFDTIQSSFESNIITQDMINNGIEKRENLGKYKVEYKSVGKNLFYPEIDEDFKQTWYNGECIISYKDGVATVTGSANNNGTTETFSHPNYARQQLKPNTTYTLSYKSDAPYGEIHGEDTTEMFVFSLNKDYSIDYSDTSSFTSIQPTGGSFTTGPTGYVSFRFDINKNTTTHKFYDIQLEENSVATPYEEYHETKNTFYLNSPLLDLDTIEVINGKAYHVKRSKQLILDGSDDEYWVSRISNFPSNTTSLFAYRIYNFSYGGDLCDKFTRINVAIDVDKEGFQTSVDGDGYAIYIRINKSKLSADNLYGFKEWLKDNPVNIIHKLAEPIYEPINSTVSTEIFEGITHITNNSNVDTNMELKVDRVANRARDSIALAKSNPTLSNISNARYWSNLMRESTLKDSFQNDLDGTTDILGLTIEKKNISSNSDVYIKMQNGLSLSLDTNYIVFNDFDSTESMELKNAVNLKVNSSLPYKINAYLEDELYNADKSEKIDKSVFNIKLSNDNDYKAFKNTTDPLVLLDNHLEGTNISHSLDFKLNGGSTNKADVYKTVIKLEIEQN